MVAATRCPPLHGFDQCCPSGAAAAGFLTAQSNMRTVQVATVQRDKIIGNLGRRSDLIWDFVMLPQPFRALD
jgi:hypothetical protein